MPSRPARRTSFRGTLTVIAALSLFLNAALVAHPALALSELRPIPGQTDETTGDEPDAETEDEAPLQLPMPDPLIRKDEAVTDEGSDDEDMPVVEPQPPVEVLYDISKAPEAVARMRELIVEAAASGDIERLRPLLGKGPTQTRVSLSDTDEDPVSVLKGLSGDAEGVEILAILLDLFATGFVHTGAGTPDEVYVWPYFTEKTLSTLSPPEKVEMLRLVTAGDFADMLEFGGYNFYRVGITPDGQWKFFVAGD